MLWNQVSKGEAADIKKLIKNSDKKENIKTIIEFVRENKGIEYAVKTSNEYSIKAKKALNIYPDSPAKIAMEALVDFIIDRKN